MTNCVNYAIAKDMMPVEKLGFKQMSNANHEHTKNSDIKYGLLLYY